MIIVDERRRLIHVTLQGVMDQDAVDAFFRDLDGRARALTHGMGGHLLLIDMRTLAIQSQDTIARFQADMRKSDVHAARIAVVVPMTLTRNQARRVILQERDTARMFESLDPAMKWVVTGVEETTCGRAA